IGTDPWTACNSIAQLKTGYVRGKPYLSFVGTGQRGFYGKQAYAVDVLQEVVVQALAARLQVGEHGLHRGPQVVA
ncbi:hypothetical protein, partial [Pseudomonas aeruginosa]